MTRTQAMASARESHEIAVARHQATSRAGSAGEESVSAVIRDRVGGTIGVSRRRSCRRCAGTDFARLAGLCTPRSQRVGPACVVVAPSNP